MNIKSSESSSERLHFSRRQFLKRVGALGAGSLLLAACAPLAIRSPSTTTPSAVKIPPAAGTQTDEIGGAWTSFDAVTCHNNYHELSPEKEAVGLLSKNSVTAPWTAPVGALVQRPKGSSWPRN